jgi:nucleotide-binding universal stress UspA family protein
MLPIHTILHPTDFSEHSNVAFRIACSLAQDYHAKLLVFHVAPVQMVGAEGIIAPPEGYREALLQKLLELQARPAQVQIEHRLVEGEPVDTILRVAQEDRCDVIVLGTHGRTGLGRVLMGSVAEQIVRKAPCPVVAVKTLLPQKSASAESGSEKTGTILA